jgi:hypothetical protein
MYLCIFATYASLLLLPSSLNLITTYLNTEIQLHFSLFRWIIEYISIVKATWYLFESSKSYGTCNIELYSNADYFNVLLDYTVIQ